MNLDLSFDGVSVSTDPEDAELARHAKATAESVRDLATYVAGEARTQCHNCGNTRACRPVAVKGNNGQAVKAPTCAECQAHYVDARVEREEQQAEANQIVAEAEAQAEQIIANARQAAAEDLADDNVSYNANVDTPEADPNA